MALLLPAWFPTAAMCSIGGNVLPVKENDLQQLQTVPRAAKAAPNVQNAKLSKLFKKKHEVFVEQLKAVNPNLEPLEE